MLQKLYSVLHCLVGLLVLVSLAGCKTTALEQQTARNNLLASLNKEYRDDLRQLTPGEPHIILTCQNRFLSASYRLLITDRGDRLNPLPLTNLIEKQFGGGPVKEGEVFTIKAENGSTCMVTSVQIDLSPSEQKAQAQLQQQQQQQAMQGRSNTCKGFGFKENTEAHAQCMFDLFKLEQQAAAQQLAVQSQAVQNQAVQSQAASNAAAQRALLQQQIDQQNFNQGIQLLQQSQQLLNPPTPTTNCQWYYATQTMRCR